MAPSRNNDCSGQQMPRAPDFSGTAEYTHTFQLANSGRGEASGHVRYSTSYWSAVDYNPLQLQDSFTTYGLSLTYVEPNEHWSFQAWART